MVTKKLSKLNAEGTVGISLPKKLSQKLGWSFDDFVSITIVGNTLHIVKVHLE